MLEPIFRFVVSAIVIVFAARWLTQASDEIAEVTGLGRLFIGSLFLAASTSAPEFFININATLNDLPDLASGDLLGASLMNLVYFAILSVIYGIGRMPIGLQGIRISSLLAALLAAEVGLLIYFQPNFQLFGFSIGGMLLIVTYIFGMRLFFKQVRVPTPKSRFLKVSPRKILKPILKFFIAAMAIFFISPLLVASMEEIALTTGLGHTFIGMTLLALTTSFPELISSITAMRMGLFDLMLGNIVGSSIFNMLIFVFMEWSWQGPSIWEHISKSNAVISGILVLNMLIIAFVWGGFFKKRSASLSFISVMLVLLLSMTCYGFLYFSIRST